jgi:cytochrome P450
MKQIPYINVPLIKFECLIETAQTVSSLSSFFLAMTLYPQVQKLAQEELDRVLASDAMPTFEYRPQLPYIEAVTREVVRWHPVAPEGE